MKILMVEDNQDFAHFLRKKLARAHHEKMGALDVQHVDDLSSALECLGRGDYDLVLLDLLLPDSVGLETFRRVHNQAPETPIVMLTGVRDELLAEKALQEGAQDFLLKENINEDFLMRAVRFAIERHRILKEWKAAWEIEKAQATHDPLTELPNRVLFQDRLHQAMALARRQEKGLAVLFIDLDHFKHVNDTLGHLIGDDLLKMVANRLRNAVREEDTVARLGGDEFVVILYGIDAEKEISAVAQRIHKKLSDPYFLNGHKLFVTASIGISLYTSKITEPAQLVQNADFAMYLAKDLGGNVCQYYSELP